MEPEQEKELGATYVSLDELLKESDFVSLHPNMTPETHHMIGAREFGLMKNTAYIINTARGPVIDEKALVKALAGGQIAGAGLDVFEAEPYIEPELLKMDNVVLTPHLGSAVLEQRDRMANVVVDNIEALLAGKPLPNCVNPQVFS
jgi:glyoxylate reductase